jgi:hypothetical protein
LSPEVVFHDQGLEDCQKLSSGGSNRLAELERFSR